MLTHASRSATAGPSAIAGATVCEYAYPRDASEKAHVPRLAQHAPADADGRTLLQTRRHLVDRAREEEARVGRQRADAQFRVHAGFEGGDEAHIGTHFFSLIFPLELSPLWILH